ncbi:S-layer homology domain-containing protein [Paenibacillus sp. P36]|uniref:S-layer homology domain-containing protein n=1 Tax=Paenibacillus sp. P36 TaxID=3342538 RepID=UPI0038B2F472
MKITIRKTVAFTSAMLLMLGLHAAGPMRSASATAHIMYMNVVGLNGVNTQAYLIAGNKYKIRFRTDKADSTIDFVGVKYSPDGSAWADVIGDFREFTIPVDPRYVSVQVKMTDYFYPVIGSNSYDEEVIGPYPVLQPGSITDVEIVSNDDGSITLNWTDNSNMETYYSIKRDGPDGTKNFTVKNTTDYIGTLSYVDKETSKKNGDIYAYTIAPIIDKYTLDPGNEPGKVVRLAQVKTKSTAASNIDTSILIKPLTNLPNLDISKLVVNLNKVLTNKLTLNKSSLHLQPGQVETLIATVAPATANNKNVSWNSDNASVATVDATGKVVGVGAGTVKITASAEDGGSQVSAYVTVIQPIMPSTGTEPDFTDTNGHWAEMIINNAASYGIVNGYPDGSFKPDGSVTRAEFATMLMKAVGFLTPGGLADPTAPLSFEDADQIGSWAVTAIQQAVQLGIISGYPDGTFRPGAGITHSEMLAMAVRATKHQINVGGATGYNDDGLIPSWAKDFVATGKQFGLIANDMTPGNIFGPYKASTRAESASVILNMLNP